ncbi:MAG: PaaI family thioesterase [Pseudomonadota bacterium]
MTERSRTVTWQDPAISAAAHAGNMTGLAFLTAIVEGTVAQPPIARSLDFRLAEVSDGRAVFHATPQEFHFNPIGTVHGGFYGTLLDSCMSCAVHATLPAGVGYTTVEFKVNVVRGLRTDAGEISAVGEVVHRGRRIATSQGRIVDADGKLYAHGTATCMLLAQS